MENTPVSVAEAVALVNQTLDYAFPTLVVEGEIASFKVNQGKFVFFDLKDDEASLGCFMMVFQLRTVLETGMRVQVVAVPKLTAWGKFSLTVRDVRPVGEGSIKRAFELLRGKLEKEGLFAPERKRPLPSVPGRIAVISSIQAAGYADFMRILDERWGGVDVQVAHVQVQGGVAPGQMVRALAYFNAQPELADVVVMIRGGGSADDLAAFNDEALVRAIAASRIPTLVGVGHEIDETLADYAADVRSATPSHAAQLVVPNKHDVLRAMRGQLSQVMQRVEAQVEETSLTIRSCVQQMFELVEGVLSEVARELDHRRTVLLALDPKNVLERGYAIVRGDDRVGGRIEVERAHNVVIAEVTHVTAKN